VGDVRNLYAAEPTRIGTIFERIGEISRAARDAIEGGDLARLGTLMNENHGLLRELTVSDEMMDRVCAVAVEAGAFGAKLSGGGRGGNVIMLVRDEVREDVEKALKMAAVEQVIHTVVGEKSD
jgi:mevalonate kinase